MITAATISIFQDKPEIRRHVEAFRAFRGFRRNSKVFLQRRFIPYSLQYHLAGLPARQRHPILAEILAGAGGPPGQDLERFLLAHFGPTLVRLFFAPYLEKFYGRPLTAMIAGMDKGSIPIPRKEDVLAGALRRRSCAEGYNPVFYYPSGALQAFIDDYSRPLAGRIRCQEEVLAIEPARKQVITRTGSYRYDSLISTMPLKQLLGIMAPPPPFPRQRLRHLSTLVVNAVLARRRRRFHWLYLPEAHFPLLPRRLVTRRRERSACTWRRRSPPIRPSIPARPAAEALSDPAGNGNDRRGRRASLP